MSNDTVATNKSEVDECTARGYGPPEMLSDNAMVAAVLLYSLTTVLAIGMRPH
jgi:hypothetical protein